MCPAMGMTQETLHLGYANLTIEASNINVQFQKISILFPQKGLEFPGGWEVQ